MMRLAAEQPQPFPDRLLQSARAEARLHPPSAVFLRLSLKREAPLTAYQAMAVWAALWESIFFA